MDEFRQCIEKIVQEMEARNKKELHDAIDSVFQSRGKNELVQSDDRKFSWCFPLIILFLIIISFFISLTVKVTNLSSTEIKDILFMLAFVVALASYLASVIREVVKKLPKQQEKNVSELRLNISLMATAEISLVIFAILAVIRIFIGNELLFNKVYFNVFLMSYLSVILLWLSALHVRIWCKIKPWRI